MLLIKSIIHQLIEITSLLSRFHTDKVCHYFLFSITNDIKIQIYLV